MDQFEKISRILGKPDNEDWPDAKRLAERKMFTMPDHKKVSLTSVIPRASVEAISLMEWMLQYNPKKRPRPSQIMQHEFFHPKTLTGQPKTASITETTAKETTAETSVSRIESIILGNNNLQIKTRILEQSPLISQTRNMASLE
jgi:serine/threonine protein kinase